MNTNLFSKLLFPGYPIWVHYLGFTLGILTLIALVLFKPSIQDEACKIYAYDFQREIKGTVTNKLVQPGNHPLIYYSTGNNELVWNLKLQSDSLYYEIKVGDTVRKSKNSGRINIISKNSQRLFNLSYYGCK